MVRRFHHIGGNRIQWDTHDHLPWTGGSRSAYWQVHDETWSLTAGANQWGLISPISWITAGTGIRTSTASNTPNAGTISINHTTLAATFSVSQAGLIQQRQCAGDLGDRFAVPVSGFDGSTHCILTKIVGDGDAVPLATDLGWCDVQQCP